MTAAIYTLLAVLIAVCVWYDIKADREIARLMDAESSAPAASQSAPEVGHG